MPSPSPQNYLDVAAWTYNSGMKPGVPDASFTPFAVNGNHYQSANTYDAYDPATGFYAAAYVQGTGQDRTIVVGFEGTNLGDFSSMPQFSTAEVLADVALYGGLLPPALTQAAAFVRALSGSYSGVVGLPLWETAQLLRGRSLLHP